MMSDWLTFLIVIAAILAGSALIVFAVNAVAQFVGLVLEWLSAGD